MHLNPIVHEAFMFSAGIRTRDICVQKTQIFKLLRVFGHRHFELRGITFAALYLYNLLFESNLLTLSSRIAHNAHL